MRQAKNSQLCSATNTCDDYYSVAIFLNCLPRVRFAKIMLAKEDKLRLTLVESNGCVLPVSYMVTKSNAKHLIA